MLSRWYAQLARQGEKGLLVLEEYISNSATESLSKRCCTRLVLQVRDWLSISQDDEIAEKDDAEANPESRPARCPQPTSYLV